MGDLLLSFHAKVEHGCLVIRDLQSADDISEWDPSEVNWHRAGTSIIFAVLPGSEGWVDCEVWEKSPVQSLPVALFAEDILPESGWLVVHDPNERVRMQFRGGRGRLKISAFADDREFASKVQLVIDPLPG